MAQQQVVAVTRTAVRAMVNTSAPSANLTESFFLAEPLSQR
jgi:hypothetical protein